MPQISRAAEPTHEFFDAWNACTTGHQRSDSRFPSSTSWRESRTAKINKQLSDISHNGQGGCQKRVHDTVGAGSKDFGQDGRLPNGGWERGASELRRQLGGHSQTALSDFWRMGKTINPKSDMESTKVGESAAAQTRQPKRLRAEGNMTESENVPDNKRRSIKEPAVKQIFANMTFFVNGSTYPVVSDHKLKRLLLQRGGSLSIGLARRKVTHVILGRPLSAKRKGEAGVLAASKIQKEIASGLTGRSGINSGIQFVCAEWVLECVAKERKVGEWSVPRSGSESVGQAPKQSSVLGAFRRVGEDG